MTKLKQQRRFTIPGWRPVEGHSVWKKAEQPCDEEFRGVRINIHPRASAGYPENWPENVPSAIQELVQAVSERELRIDLLEIVVNELKASLRKIQSQQSSIAAINTFHPEPYELLKPLFISLQPVEMGFIAGWHDANIYSSGETEEEAVQNLKSQILDFFDSLSGEAPEKLGPEPKKQFSILGAFIRKKS
jgi:hypothetical protein